jgi:predicted transcriptional regulator YheO
MKKAQALSKADELIINTYMNTVDALAAYLGDAFEVVLHRLDDFDRSVIKAVNAVHSGRSEGAPITDLALSILEGINNEQDDGAGSGLFRTYYSKSKYGKPVKSVTMVICGTKGRAIGLLCINMYLDSPISSLSKLFSFSDTKDYLSENYSNDSEELICQSLDKIRAQVEQDDTVLASQKNKEIVTILYHQGIFKLKNAVKIISGKLGISRGTVYLHIRDLEN